jgi:hypothetical protein
VNVWIHIFLTPAVVGGEGSNSLYCRFSYEGEGTGGDCLAGWVGPSTDLEDMEEK